MLTPNLFIQIHWDKSDLFIYYHNSRAIFEPLHALLSNVYNNRTCASTTDPTDTVNLVYDEFVRCLKQCDLCIVRKKVNYYKVWWDNKLNSLKDNSITKHKIWTAVGKPRQGDAYRNMIQAKTEYKRYLHEKDSLSRGQFTDALCDSLLHKDMQSFWKTWKNKFSNPPASSCVDGCNDDLNIANAFSVFTGDKRAHIFIPATL